MIIIFTTSKYPTSWIIRKLTGDECSHCAVYIPETNEVIHVNFLGLQVEPLDKFKKTNSIKHIVNIDGPIKSKQDLVNKYKDVKYDFLGLLYSGLRIIFRFMPKVNLWQTTGMLLCTEFITEIVSEEEDSLITPHGLYIKLNNQ